MATQVAPPGYNPESSLLQGGTAPIVAMRGGGSGSPPTPDYNATASLLQGGTGVIEAVKGGGKAGVVFAPQLVEERTYSKTAPPKNVVRASRSYTLEIYGLKAEKSNLALETDLSIRQRRLMRYVGQEKQTRLITSTGTLNQPDGQFAYTGYPKYGDCRPSLPLNFFDVMARKVHFMDSKAHIVWIIPNIRGNKDVFDAIYNKIIENGLLPGKEHVLVFTGVFYPDTPNETSLFLFDEILKLKEKNPGQVFVVSTPDSSLLKNGCYILENTYAMKSTLAKQQGKNKEVPTFFEPEVLVFPHENIVVRSVQMPISAESRVSVGLLLRKKVAGKSFYVKGEAGRKAEPAPESLENYTTVLSDPRQPETKAWPPKSQQTIRCPADMDCQEFELGFPLEKLGTSIFLNLLETKLYLFHITSEKIPYFTGPKEGEAEEEKEEEEEPVEQEEEEEEIELVPEPVPVIANLNVPKIPKGFYKEDPSAVSSSSTVTFPVGGFTFTVRVPASPANNDPIRIDWLNERFTKSEADLLNALQLTPSILQKVYSSGRKWHVSNFLASLALSNCFKESQLLLKSECYNARRFLRAVALEVQKECLNKATKEWGKPSKGFIKTTKNEEPMEEELQSTSTLQPINNNELPSTSTLQPFNNTNQEEEELLSVSQSQPQAVVGITSSRSLNDLTKNMRNLQIDSTPVTQQSVLAYEPPKSVTQQSVVSYEAQKPVTQQSVVSYEAQKPVTQQSVVSYEAQKPVTQAQTFSYIPRNIRSLSIDDTAPTARISSGIRNLSIV
jgi:hypothetical protein